MRRMKIKVKTGDKLLGERWSGDLFSVGTKYEVVETRGNIFYLLTNYGNNTAFKMNDFGYSFRKVYRNDK